MLRTAVTYYLMLVSLAGPALCCCTLSDLFQMPCGHARGSHDKVARSHKHVHGTSHRHVHHEHSNTVAKHCCHHQGTENPNDSRHECPCGHQSERQIAIVSTGLGESLLSAVTDGAMQHVTLVLLVPPSMIWGDVVSQSVAQLALETPFSTPAGQLRALSVLRC